MIASPSVVLFVCEVWGAGGGVGSHGPTVQPDAESMRFFAFLGSLNPAAIRSLSVCLFYATVSIALSLCNKVGGGTWWSGVAMVNRGRAQLRELTLFE